MNLMDIDKDNENHLDGSSTSQRLYFIINGKVAYQTASFKERVIKIFEVFYLCFLGGKLAEIVSFYVWHHSRKESV